MQTLHKTQAGSTLQEGGNGIVTLDCSSQRHGHVEALAESDSIFTLYDLTYIKGEKVRGNSSKTIVECQVDLLCKDGEGVRSPNCSRSQTSSLKGPEAPLSLQDGVIRSSNLDSATLFRGKRHLVARPTSHRTPSTSH